MSDIRCRQAQAGLVVVDLELLLLTRKVRSVDGEVGRSDQLNLG
jgi:hypothetical protein